MTAHTADEMKTVYWHRELPPLAAEFVCEHVVEAVSSRVANTLSHRDDLWDRCYAELMEDARARLAQEIARLGGDCAHVLSETVDTRRDDAAGEMWLCGRFTYALYRARKAA